MGRALAISIAGGEAERFGDDAALDLGGAAVDRRDQRGADEALHVVLGGVAVAAHHLHALERHPLGDFGDEELHHRGLLGEHPLGVLVGQRRDPAGHQPGRLEVGGEVGEAVLERLEGADRPAELLALLGVGEGVVEGALGDAEHRRGEDQALDVEAGHQLGPALVDLAEHRLGRGLDVVEVERVGLAAAHRLDRDDFHPVDLARDPDHRQALVLGLALGRAADDEDVVGDVGVGDEDLLAVDDEAAVDALGRGGQRADVGAGLGLGHRDRLDRAAGDPAEDLRLLLLGAEAPGRAGDDQRRRVAADRRQPARGLFHEEAGVEHRAAGAAVLLGDRDPEPAELGHLPVDVEVVMELVALGELLPLLLRAALARAEVADRGDEVLLLIGEGEVHRASVLSGARRLYFLLPDREQVLLFEAGIPGAAAVPLLAEAAQRLVELGLRDPLFPRWPAPRSSARSAA